MKSRMLIMFRLILVTALLTIVRPVMAENREGAFTLSPFVGGQGFPVVFNGEEHFDADLLWGIRAGYNFTPHLRAELVFSKDVTKRDPGDHAVSLYQYGVDLDYFFRPDKNLSPFLAAGLGGLSADFSEDFVFDARTSTVFNFGGGAEYSLTHWFALRADFRYLAIVDQGEHGFAGTLGVTFQLGRHH